LRESTRGEAAHEKPAVSSGFLEADDGVRTRDPQLGKLMLYQLSYVRVPLRITNCAAEPCSKSPPVYLSSTGRDSVEPVALIL
jgi:hypothetical protein